MSEFSYMDPISYVKFLSIGYPLSSLDGSELVGEVEILLVNIQLHGLKASLFSWSISKQLFQLES